MYIYKKGGIKILKTKLLKIIFILSIIALIVTGINVVNGQYMQTHTLKASTKIAKPIIIMEEGEKINIDGTSNEQEYQFKIKNYNEKNEISDVQMNYYLQILGNKDKAIEFELYENEKIIPIINNKTQTLKLGNKTKEEKNYILKIKYNKSGLKHQPIFKNS